MDIKTKMWIAPKPTPPLTDEQVERMVKDANFVGPQHSYAPVIFNDLCCHVRALAEERRLLRETITELEREAEGNMW